MRYFLELAYNGLDFHGWQSQPNAVSVQSTIEEALTKVLAKETPIVGAGRTDTGVNARQIYAHFDSESDLENDSKFLSSLNSLVGREIAVNKIFRVKDDAHARFDATLRTYKYFVTYRKNPFLHNFSWFSPSRLDMELMNEAALQLLETKDFTSFAKLHSDVKNNLCDVSKAEWRLLKDDPEAFRFLGSLDDGIVFTISANRFLRNMVRAIVGTLVDVGRHKISLNRFKEIIEVKNRCSAGTSMPAHALFLWQVCYPYL